MMKLAVMHVEKGEVIVASLISGHIEGTGRYKLLAKKKKDGTFSWVHFIQRLNGNKDIVFRGEAKDQAQLNTLLEVANGKLQAIFKVTLQPADADMYTLDGKGATPKLQ
jgi:hypothetical protein